MQKRQSLFIREFGKPEVLSFEEESFENTLGQEDVLIDVKYSGINFADIVMRNGLYQDAPKRPFIPGYELSGVVA